MRKVGSRRQVTTCWERLTIVIRRITDVGSVATCRSFDSVEKLGMGMEGAHGVDDRGGDVKVYYPRQASLGATDSRFYLPVFVTSLRGVATKKRQPGDLDGEVHLTHF